MIRSVILGGSPSKMFEKLCLRRCADIIMLDVERPVLIQVRELRK